MDADLSFIEISSRADDLLLPWLELYETAFPASERVLVANILDILKRKEQGEQTEEHLLSVLDTNADPIGMAMYSLQPGSEAAFLWYMAVNPTIRNRGIGSVIYQEVREKILTNGPISLVFEVEIPEGQNSRIAQRRIDFYRRQGAQLLGGIRYMQQVGYHQDPIPMHLMVHGAHSIDSQLAFELAKSVLGESLEQSGELCLD